MMMIKYYYFLLLVKQTFCDALSYAIFFTDIVDAKLQAFATSSFLNAIRDSWMWKEMACPPAKAL